MKITFTKIIALILLSISFSCLSVKNNDTTYTRNRKEATQKTKLAITLNNKNLNFNNEKDFEYADKGFIASLPNPLITNDKGETVYNLSEYDFIDGDAPSTTNPSLWRQSKLNRKHGLYEVIPDTIYQIRGFDLANMSLVRADLIGMGDNKQWVVIDPLGSPETARAGLDLANKEIFKLAAGAQNVTTVIFTHSHIDHFGGIWGVIDQNNYSKVTIYAPENFFEESVSENVMAGNTMGRRASYMYGNVLKKDEKGTLGTGLGQTTSTGIGGITDATTSIKKDTIIEKDGHDVIEFIYTPDAEAPAEMMFYFPQLKAFCQAEEINHTMHNLYTLRGAKVRNGQKWSQYIDKVIQKWGDKAIVSFGSHHWPTWENKEIVSLWENQRDMYRFIHDQTLRLANKGYTPIEIAERLKLPKAIDTVFANRGYYGTLSHNARAQYQLYFGWFDGNPANLNKLPPSKAGTQYVKYLGAKTLFDKAIEAFNDGNYRWAAEVLNLLVFAKDTEEVNKKQIKYLLADTYEQLGYQAESGPWRNFYLSGAQELRSDDPPGTGVSTVNTASPDMVSGMTNELLFNFLAIHFKGMNKEAANMKYKFQFEFKDISDSDKNVALIVQNGVITPRIGFTLDKKDITEKIELDREALNKLITSKNFSDQAIENLVKITIPSQNLVVSYVSSDFKKMIDKMENFEFWFNIIEP